MNKLKVCPKCSVYTLKPLCSDPKCKSQKTKSAHYKFLKTPDLKKTN